LPESKIRSTRHGFGWYVTFMLRPYAFIERVVANNKVKSSKLLYIVSLIAFVLVTNVGTIMVQKTELNDFLTLRLDVIIPDSNLHQDEVAMTMLSKHISKLEKVRSRNPSERET